jgi:hypothetical protein
MADGHRQNGHRDLEAQPVINPRRRIPELPCRCLRRRDGRIAIGYSVATPTRLGMLTT